MTWAMLAAVASTIATQARGDAPPAPEGRVHRLAGHTNVVAGVAFAPAGDRVVTSGFDATYRVWDARTGRELGRRPTGTDDAQVGGPVAVSPDGKRIAARYFVAEADTGKFLFGLEGHVAELTRIGYARDGKRVLTASYDGTIRVRDAGTGKTVRTIEAHMGREVPAGLRSGFGPPPELPRIVGRGVRDAAFSPDGRRIVSGGVDGMVRAWDTETGKELWGWKPSQDVLSVAYLSDGKRAASGEAEGTIRVWDVAAGKVLKTLTGHVGGVDALAPTPDGRRLVSAGADGTVRLWDIATGRELRSFRGHAGPVRAVAVSPDGATALSGGEDGTARLWRLADAGR